MAKVVNTNSKTYTFGILEHMGLECFNFASYLDHGIN